MTNIVEIIEELRATQSAVEVSAVRFQPMGGALEDKDIAERALYAWLDDKLSPHTTYIIEAMGGYLAGMYDD